MIHLITPFTPSYGFIVKEDYQAVTDGKMTFIGGKLITKTFTARQVETLLQMAIDQKIEIREETK